MRPAHKFESSYAKAKLAQTASFRDQVLAESKSFVAIPSVGALVEGWLLVVPRQPALSAGALSEALRCELTDFCDEVASLLRASYGPLAIFEHGAVTPNTSVGCGVDQAHIHLVPFRRNLHSLAKSMFADIVWRKATGFCDAAEQYSRKEPYWYLHQSEYSSFPLIGTCNGIDHSQMFRKVIAKALGSPGGYDWKHNPGVELMKRTCERLSCIPA